jgi:hypothetical protein
LTHAILLRDLPLRLLAPIDFGFLMMPMEEHVGIGKMFPFINFFKVKDLPNTRTKSKQEPLRNKLTR